MPPPQGYTPPAAAANFAMGGGFPAPTMQVLETKFREIVQMHLQAYVQDLFVSVETSLEKHLSALSGRIEQVEEQWTRSLAAGLATERQERERALSGLGQDADSLASPTMPSQVAQSTSTLPPVVSEKCAAVEVRADTLEASMSEMRTELRTVREFGYSLQQELRELSQVEQRLEQRFSSLSQDVVASQAQTQASEPVLDVRGEVSILRGELRDLRLQCGELQARAPVPGSSCNEAVTTMQGTVDRLSATVPTLQQQIEEVSIRVGRKTEEMRLALQSEVQEACARNRSILLEEVAANDRRNSVEFEAKIQNLRAELRSEIRVPASQSTETVSIGKRELLRSESAFSDVSVDDSAATAAPGPLDKMMQRSLGPVEVTQRSLGPVEVRSSTAPTDTQWQQAVNQQRRNEHLLRLALVQQALSSNCNEIDPSILKNLQEKPRPTSVPPGGTSGNAGNRRPSWSAGERRRSSLTLKPVSVDVVQRRVELVRCALRGDADLAKLQPKDGPKSGK